MTFTFEKTDKIKDLIIFKPEIYYDFRGHNVETYNSEYLTIIKKELGMDANDTTWIAEDVEKNIFSKVSDELNAIENQIEENEKENVGEKETEPQSSGVGGSFEQIILNQARAMQPAIPPENLPTGEQKQNEPPQTAVPDYRGSDPYREPVE